MTVYILKERVNFGFFPLIFSVKDYIVVNKKRLVKKNLFLLALVMLFLTSSLEAFQITTTIEDFERPTLFSALGDGVTLGDVGATGGGASLFTIITETPPTQVPAAVANNRVLSLSMMVPLNGFSVYVQIFTNAAVDKWVSKDWSEEEGISFWVYGNNTGGNLFFDILDNRNPGSTGDDAERFTVEFSDDFAGWKFFEFPWEDFARKDIGNGAPDDGLGLTEMYGFAFGADGSVMINSSTFFIDDINTYRTEVIAEPLPVMGRFPRIFLMLLLVVLGSVVMMKKGFTSTSS